LKKAPVKQSEGATSDLQAILDGKLLDVQEVSLHFMNASTLYPDEFIRNKKQHAANHNAISKLHFP
jgi:hypothetical protein